jgi:hypothetical protein
MSINNSSSASTSEVELNCMQLVEWLRFINCKARVGMQLPSEFSNFST